MEHQAGTGPWWCGGPWGQSQGLTDQQVAQIVVSYPGPHYVWTDGMAEWTPAEQVPQIATALALLGGQTVVGPGPATGEYVQGPGAVTGPIGGGEDEEEDEDEDGIPRNKIVFLGLIGLLVLLMCALGAVVIVSTLKKAPEVVQATPQAAPEPTPEPTPPPPPPIPRVETLLTRPTSWSRVPIKDNRRRHGYGTASSELQERNGTRHAADRVGDVKAETAWCESATDDGVGEWVELSIDCGRWTSKGVAGLGIRAGYGSKTSAWRQNNRVAEALLTLDVSGEVVFQAEVALTDQVGQQWVPFPNTLRCASGETVRANIEIISVYQGTAYTDTCISTLAFYQPEY